ncbi:hypothetical protein J4P02_17695 [Pseudomonas sp. NFXW11]|uniref:hypothetical protein n=1 Tax=Pseudomonas sp. NFXW11 TaxID=2819531 RepID=UPI003CEDEF47
MLPATFCEIFSLYRADSTFKHPHVLGLNSFSPQELAAHGYERIGEASDLHFYEKNLGARYQKKTLGLLCKRYFCNDQDLGSGFSIAPGVRLTTLLKHAKNVHPDWVFYFSSDKRDGAAILDQRIVLRFSQCSRKGAYLLSTLESDFNTEHSFANAATRAVKATLQQQNLREPLSAAGNKQRPAAFRRLARWLCQRDH